MYQSDNGYTDRNQAFLALAKLAKGAGMDCGIGFDPKEPEWPFVFICLPTGQVAAHYPAEELAAIDWLPRYPHNEMWDGHTLEQKRSRMAEFIGKTQPAFLWRAGTPGKRVATGETV